ncbi:MULTISPECIES: CheR family methyltransferase [Marinobacter]|uniref:CheR family methyltransferase n=1 Tax=Marinobacter TaxID=2742 RepID=UPI000DAF0ACD|nr:MULTISPECIES: protein-glutamate O-methyltransferase CheR [Marinobacter]
MKSEITPQEYDAFKTFLQDACGILLGENKQYLVKSRLRKILEENGFDTLGGLVKQLQRPRDPLRQVVIDAMTTNETLWFRDTHPFRILTERLLPELAEQKGGQPLRIWSAACSTGQEPYSIAMAIDEFRRLKPGKLRGDVKITATDISRSVLDVARKGEYEMLAIGRGLSPERQRNFFAPSPSGGWQIKPAIKSMVEFKELNLLERYMLGKFDLVFCRNVLIYFSADLKKDILTRMHGALSPGGYLILGASESLNGLPEYYEMVQCQPGIIYRAKKK